jgi:protein-L-isoaspartate(D-aspartate) O-methyltransferase
MDDSTSVRRRYAALIQEQAELRSERLVRAPGEIPREDFLGPGPWKIMRFVFPLKYEETLDADPADIYDDVLVALDADHMLKNGLQRASALDRRD